MIMLMNQLYGHEANSQNNCRDSLPSTKILAMVNDNQVSVMAGPS